MPLNITTNSAASSASYYLAKNQAALQKSMTRLASGKRIVAPYDDPGSLSVSMKLNASISRLSGAQNNLQSAISFLEVQDGILESAGKILNRMNELKGMASQDPMKSAQDIASYDNEFRDLQVQIYDMAQQTFNGVSLFARYAVDGTTQSVFRTASTNNTISIHASTDGSSGSKVSLHKATLLSALTVTDNGALAAASFDTTGASGKHTGTGAVAATASIFSFAAASSSDAFNLSAVSSAVFEQALANVAFLRAQVGGTMSRVTFASENISLQKTNMKAALGRIVDVDIAEESTELAKFNILTQASAAMLAQANTSADVALMLLR
jgi:flagellin